MHDDYIGVRGGGKRVRPDKLVPQWLLSAGIPGSQEEHSGSVYEVAAVDFGSLSVAPRRGVDYCPWC